MLDKLDKSFINAKNGRGKIICYSTNEKNSSIEALFDRNQDKIMEDVRRYGGALLRNFDIRSVSEFNKLANKVCSELFDYVNRSTPRTKLGGKIYTATEYPADRYIPFHNENAYTLKWPNIIMFFSVIAAEEGGETAIADSRYVYQNLPKNIINKFNDKKVLYVRNYSQGVDLSWQEVFQTENREDVEKYCNENSINFEWREGLLELTTRQICQATINHPETEEDVWFNQAHLFHSSSIKEEDRIYLIDLLGKGNIPRNAFYGDGEEIEEDVLSIIRQAYEKERIEFFWKKGDLMILDNRLMAHSRNPFKGERKVVVAMGV